MKNFFRAEEIFKNFPDDVRSKIFAVADGKLVYFPRNKNRLNVIDRDKVITDYTVGEKSYDKIAKEKGTNKMRICRIIHNERSRFSKKRIKYWRGKGLSYRNVAKLYKKSHERIRQVVGGGVNSE